MQDAGAFPGFECVAETDGLNDDPREPSRKASPVQIAMPSPDDAYQPNKDEQRVNRSEECSKKEEDPLRN